MSYADFAVIGAGPGGLMAAMTLGRMNQSVLLFDDGRPRNEPSPQMRNVLGFDGCLPSEYKEVALKNVLNYSNVEFINEQIVQASKSKSSFELTTQLQGKFTAQKVILATGVRDVLPQFEGLDQFWGKGLYHCPFCHGYEVRNKKILFFGKCERALQVVKYLSKLTKELTWITHSSEKISEEVVHSLRKQGIEVINGLVQNIERTFTGEFHVSVENQSRYLRFDAIFTKPPQAPLGLLGAQLGLTLNSSGIFEVGPQGQTAVHGLFVAGDLSTPLQSVVLAQQSGFLASAAALQELIDEQWAGERSDGSYCHSKILGQ